MIEIEPDTRECPECDEGYFEVSACHYIGCTCDGWSGGCSRLVVCERCEGSACVVLSCEECGDDIYNGRCSYCAGLEQEAVA